ncbi:hypothetical protein [Paraburkholderia sp. DHOC27]|uniref:hypothetical protein n=1 Tax=Paraburkholderia sp. DHOC27 TaxID=2303330 RepID=UPI000E3DDCB2|nr:hypothetical protein [Paraburkholderia sp. DHOC27]RFU44532.1 hypothetical protein D0B32_28470 [Paraburkholderia sp. DHOC27]
MSNSENPEKAEKHWSHHPLLGILVGFILTGIFGAIIAAGITYYSNELAADREHLTARIATRLSGILAASHSLYLYVGYASRLYEESVDGVPREVLMQTEKLYVEALAEATAAIPSTVYVTSYDDGKDRSANPIRNAYEDEINKVVYDGVGPLLQSVDHCVMSAYLTRLAHPSVAIEEKCPAFSDQQYGDTPRAMKDRIDLYQNCVDAFTEILLAIGADPEERAWGDNSALKRLAADIHSDAGECQPLKLPAPQKQK